MRREFSDKKKAQDFANKVKGQVREIDWTENIYWVVTWDESKFDLRPFIRECLTDEEFWLRAGIPEKEKYYIEKLNMTNEQVGLFYDSMCGLQQLAKEIGRQEGDEE